jgi:hypothetical protein
VQARSVRDLDALEREARDLLAQRHRSRSGLPMGSWCGIRQCSCAPNEARAPRCAASR